MILYQLKKDRTTNSKNLTIGSDISESLKSLISSESFSSLSKSETIVFINKFIQTCNSANKTKTGKILFTDTNNKFPIFYRPNNITYNYMKSSVPPKPIYNQNYSSIGNKIPIGSDCNINIRAFEFATGKIVASGSDYGKEIETDKLYQSVVNQVTTKLISQNIENVLLPTIDQLDDTLIVAPTTTTSTESTSAFKNVTDIYNQIKLLPALKQGGYGLIYAQDKVGTPISFKSTKVPQSSYLSDTTTYGALGSDNLFLLSHNSSIPGKGKINFDDTLYGISLDQFVDEILPKTSSLVRGEELLELLNVIVRFLITHEHGYPGEPPVTITQDGSSVSNVLKELNDAYENVLNQYIRLN